MADAEENGNVDVDRQDPQDGDQNKKLSLAEKRKLRKKKSKQNKQQLRAQQSAREQQRAQQKDDATKLDAEEEKVEILYVSEPLSLPDAKESGTERPAVAGRGEQAEANDDTANEDNSSEPAVGAGAAEEQAMEDDEGQEDDAAPTAGLGLGFVRSGPKPAAEDGGEEDADEPYSEFLRIFQKFGTAEQVTGAEPFGDEEEEGEGEDEGGDGQQAEKGEEGDDEKDSDDEDEDGKPKLSKKQQKLQSQMQIAALKQTCMRPEVVEVWDVTAPDPTLLVYLKAYRNTVSVPRHWSQKRKYLQGKRGIEKPAFALPEFIEATGIGEMRQAYHEKEEAKKLKQKQKDLMRPKMGRLDLDYQILHDAFFKHQTKPSLTGMGSLYYEGKEFEAKPRNVRAGVLSEATRSALGMSNGAPPPWLINMQRYGPPPSYPHLRIPGLNAPIPQGAEFGYQPGGWGKPPVNEAGEPLYGDVFGERGEDEEPFPAFDKAFRWGDLESEEESEEEEEEEEEEEGEPEGDAAAEAQLADGIASGIISGITSSLPSGLETPSEMELRKGMRSSSTMGGADSEAPQLYQVLPQKQAAVGSDLMGSSHVYQLPGQGPAGAPAPAGAAARQMMDMLGRSGGGGAGDVSLALDPSELEGLDDAELKQRYEAEIAARRAGTAREDFSDMVAAKAAAQKRKLAQKQSESAKKHKDFKF